MTWGLKGPVLNSQGECFAQLIRVDSDGTVLEGSEYVTVAKGATGVYVVTFKKPYGRTPLAFVQTLLTDSRAKVAQTYAAITVTTEVNGTDTDSAFNLLVLGWEDSVER
jgi:hypothetical protein